MLAGVNDDEACARELAALMRGHLYHVNLIPYNATPDGPFAGTSDASHLGVCGDSRCRRRSDDGPPEHGPRHRRRLRPTARRNATEGARQPRIVTFELVDTVLAGRGPYTFAAPPRFDASIVL